MQDHRRLRAFELADQLALLVYEVTRAFPREEQFGLTSQLRRAAVSGASNIVEGCARDTQNDYLRFLDIAYGSSREVEYQLSIARRLDYAQESTLSEAESLSTETCKVLGALIRSIRKRNN